MRQTLHIFAGVENEKTDEIFQLENIMRNALHIFLQELIMIRQMRCFNWSRFKPVLAATWQ